MPHVGYRLVKGSLEAQGHRVQWIRAKASMHSTDSLGMLSRMTVGMCFQVNRLGANHNHKMRIMIQTHQVMCTYC